MKCREIVEGVRKRRAAVGLASTERHCGAIIGERQMIIRPRNKWAVGAAVVGDAADGNAAEGDPMIPFLSSDQPKAAGLAFSMEIGARNLQRGVTGLRAGIDEEDVIESVRCERGDLARQRESVWMGELESRRKIELRGSRA